jgi:hypothetical protein
MRGRPKHSIQPGTPISRLAQSKDFTQKEREPKQFSAHKTGTKDSFLPSTAVFRLKVPDGTGTRNTRLHVIMKIFLNQGRNMKNTTEH